MDKQFILKNEPTNFLLYSTPNGDVKVEIYLHDENIWLPQKKMAELFGVDSDSVSYHLKNIYKDRELDESATTEEISVVQKEGERDVKRKLKFYNLDVIIAVGYRVNSKKATQFRIWASKILKEYIIKGFAMDDERLKNPNQPFGKDYFDEQLHRIRDIRSSERRLYQKITDIYAQCSIDYDVKSNITQEFFATVQNKLHWAIAGETAAEIIYHRVDSSKENMGLTSWKNAPTGKIRKDDVSVAKNHLSKDELEFFNRIVTMYLDYAEFQAKNKNTMTMHDWVKKLDAFLSFNEQDILTHKGKVSNLVATSLAYEEHEKYKTIQDKMYISDFDKLLKELDKKS